MPRGHVLLLEDHRDVAQATARLLTPLADVRVAMTLREARSIFTVEVGWDCLLVDVRLPDGDGLDFLQQARDSGVCVPALVLTAYDDRRTINRAFDLGARFLVKGYHDVERIRSFVEQVVRGETGDSRVAIERWTTRYQLTPCENAILSLALRRLTMDQIALERGISRATLKNHVKNILAKTGDLGLVHAALRLATEAWDGLS